MNLTSSAIKPTHFISIFPSPDEPRSFAGSPTVSAAARKKKTHKTNSQTGVHEADQEISTKTTTQCEHSQHH
jgi:hypothetical protein